MNLYSKCSIRMLIFSMSVLLFGNAYSTLAQSTIVYFGRSAITMDWHIYSMDIYGSNAVRLTADEGTRPDWSPDGSRIVFCSRGTLAFINPDGTGYRPFNEVTFPGLPNNPAFSPDGLKIAFEAISDDISLFILDPDTRQLQPLAPHAGKYRDANPSWSPDGKRIVFSSDRDPAFWPVGGEHASDLYVVEVETGEIRNLTQSVDTEFYPSWSPDDSFIAYVYAPQGFWGQLHTLDLQTGKKHRLTDFKPPFGIMSVSCSPDGKQILLSVVSQKWRRPDIGEWGEDIYVVNRDGSGLRALTDNAGFDMRGPKLFGSFLAVSPLGRRLSIWGQIKRNNR